MYSPLTVTQECHALVFLSGIVVLGVELSCKQRNRLKSDGRLGRHTVLV